jgi:DNA-binding CsgD family transcriptional regulator
MLRWQALGPQDLNAQRLSGLSIPLLIMHSRDYALATPEEGMKIAEVSGGRFVLLDGDDPLGDVTQGMRALDAFLAEVDLGQKPAPSSTDGLSSRELEVLRLIAAGRSNQQIGEELVISVNTVQRHVSNIFAKTGMANRTEAAGYAVRNGLA